MCVRHNGNTDRISINLRLPPPPQQQQQQQ